MDNNNIIVTPQENRFYYYVRSYMIEYITNLTTGMRFRHIQL